MKEDSEKAISFFGAFLIPGVIEFSLCLFSAKLVYYVFLFWLPHYIKVLSLIVTTLLTFNNSRNWWKVSMLGQCLLWPTTLTTAP